MGIAVKEDNVRSLTLETEHLESLQKDVLNELSVILEKQGIILNVEEAAIKLFWTTDRVEEKRTRNAGVKKKEIPVYSLSEIEQMIKEMGREGLYDFLGISRSTFYRRWKEAKEKKTKGEKNPYF